MIIDLNIKTQRHSRADGNPTGRSHINKPRKVQRYNGIKLFSSLALFCALFSSVGEAIPTQRSPYSVCNSCESLLEARRNTKKSS